MMDNDFKDFMDSHETVPQKLREATLSYTLIALNPGKTLTKFYLSHLMGGLLTLFVCPQYGYGPMNNFFHYIMDFGAVWCGIFCAGVFFIGANVSSQLILRRAELDWVSNHKISVLGSWVTFLFFAGMIAKYYAPGDMHYSSATHYFSWYASALVVTFAFFSTRKLRFSER